MQLLIIGDIALPKRPTKSSSTTVDRCAGMLASGLLLDYEVAGVLYGLFYRDVRKPRAERTVRGER